MNLLDKTGDFIVLPASMQAGRVFIQNACF